jgi:hypothetical protein
MPSTIAREGRDVSRGLERVLLVAVRWSVLALVLLFVAAAVSLVGPFRGCVQIGEERAALQPVEPPDGRGWVEGLAGLYGVAREKSPSFGADSTSVEGVTSAERFGPDLGAIGYAPGSEPPREDEPMRSDAARVAPGVNLMTSGDRARAELRALDDTLLHAWEVPYEAHRDLPPLEGAHQAPWRRVTLLEDGSLLAIHDGRALVRIGPDSTPIWASPLRAHHDLALEGDRIHVLTRGERIVPEVHPKVAIVDDEVTTLDLAGNVLSELSLWEAFVQSEFRSMLDQLTVRTGDVMHSNSIELLDGRLASRNPAFAAGNWLLCARDLDLVFVIDPRAGCIVWLATGPWRAPHHPTVTEHGTVLLFDNLGRDGDSRLLELEAVNGAIVSQWAPSDPADFSTQFCGVAAPLSNGNVLVTETCRGRAFELNPTGEVVWEYHSPRRAGPADRYVAALFEVERVARDHPGVRAVLGD